jgi:hypothetical protein
MKSEGSLLSSQEPATAPCPEPENKKKKREFPKEVLVRFPLVFFLFSGDLEAQFARWASGVTSTPEHRMRAT